MRKLIREGIEAARLRKSSGWEFREEMTNDSLILLAELPGLEAAKRAIEDRIAFIRKNVSPNGVAVPFNRPIDPNDPTVLGRDSLGRIKRKRKLSPEALEQKRELIAKARASYLAKHPKNDAPPDASVN